MIQTPGERTQYNKLRGLNKLKIITKGSENFGTVPYKVYKNAEQFRTEHGKGRRRLLVRTDEIGKKYAKTIWTAAPRDDVYIREHNLRAKPEEKVWAGLNNILSRGQNNRKLLQIIAHPLPNRGKTKWTGQIFLPEKESGMEMAVKLWENPDPDEKSHRRILEHHLVSHGGGFFPFSVRKGKIVFLEFRRDGIPPKIDSEKKEILKNCTEFLEKAIKTKQIQLKEGRAHEIGFVTYKDKPGFLEFYDLVEWRKRQ